MIWPKEVTLMSRTQPSGPLCLWQCFWIKSGSDHDDQIQQIPKEKKSCGYPQNKNLQISTMSERQKSELFGSSYSFTGYILQNGNVVGRSKGPIPIIPIQSWEWSKDVSA